MALKKITTISCLHQIHFQFLFKFVGKHFYFCFLLLFLLNNAWVKWLLLFHVVLCVSFFYYCLPLAASFTQSVGTWKCDFSPSFHFFWTAFSLKEAADSNEKRQLINISAKPNQTILETIATRETESNEIVWRLTFISIENHKVYIGWFEWDKNRIRDKRFIMTTCCSCFFSLLFVESWNGKEKMSSQKLNNWRFTFTC